ncbi:MAG: M56 family metallopeptidase [Psychroflexus sp.]|nr:M56 family metallopeptidase [Psychroflexus sp.]
MIKYVIDIIILQSIFLTLYQLIAKTPYFKINRWYLVSSMFFSLLLPAINFQIINTWLTIDSGFIQPINRLQEIVIQPGPENKNLQNSADNLSIWEVIKWIIISISGYKLVKLALALNQIRCILDKADHEQTKDHIHYYRLKDNEDAFTFFNHIVIGEDIPKHQIDYILTHEKVHAKALHSIDLLIVELLRSIMWFNPLFYIYKKAIILNHEYEADAVTVNEKNKYQYMNSLINKEFNTATIQFVNPFFNQSNLKNRIIMLQQKKMKPVQKMKYVFILPALLLCFTYLSCSEDQKNETMNVSISNVQKAPIFPGCETYKTNDKLKKCMSQKISKLVSEEFDTSLGKELGLSGVNHVYVQFKINTEGEIIDIKARASHPELKKEGLRVVDMLPDMQAGIQDGKKVNVIYQLPITFKIEE